MNYSLPLVLLVSRKGVGDLVGNGMLIERIKKAYFAQ